MNPKDFLSKMQGDVCFDKTQQGVFKMRLIKPGLMSNSDSTGYWTQSLLLNPTKCMPLFSVNQPSLQMYFLHTNSYLSIMFGIHDLSKCLLMSRPQKAGIFSLKFNRNTHFSTKLQKMHHLEHKSSGKWLPWKTEFLHILIGIKKSFNSSVFLMYFRHLLTFPPLSFSYRDSRKKRQGEIQN